MDGFNFQKKADGFMFYSHDLDDYKKHGKKVVHWLPADEDNIKASIMMPDKNVVEGIAEKYISEINEGEVIQFERFGFCRLDDKKEMRFWFTH